MLWPYLKNYKVLACPSTVIPNHFFDYTMIGRFAGAKTTLKSRVSYPLHPENSASPRKFFQAIPVLVEESQFFYNVMYDDGSFGNLDQFSTRHQNGCNVGFLDGSVALFVPPVGPKPGVQEPQDLCCNNLIYEFQGASYNPGQAASIADYGWANKPTNP